MIADREQRVRQRAHDIWQTEGCPEGRAEEHWARAEQEIADEAMEIAEPVALPPVVDKQPAAPPKPKAKATKPAAAPKPAAKAAGNKAAAPKKTPKAKTPA